MKLNECVNLTLSNKTMDEEYLSMTFDILNHPNFLSLTNYIAHGDFSVYAHVLNVSYCAYLYAKDKKKYDLRSLVRGALLHDYYLYDWHDKNHPKLHGFRHPLIALKNATKDFELNKIEKDIIKKHMFPFTFYLIPKYKESFLVSKIDTKMAIKEMK